MLTKEEFSKLFWSFKPWHQNGTYPDWPWMVYEFIKANDVKIVLEIGVATGAVSFAVAMTNPKRYYLIDNEAENHDLMAVIAELPVLLKSAVAYRGDSADQIKNIMQFELVIHDGEHSCASVSHDLGYAFEHGASWAIVHDGNWDEVVNGVKITGRPWKYLEREYGYPILVARDVQQMNSVRGKSHE